MLKVFRDNLKYLSWVLWGVIAVFVLFVFVDFGGTVPGGSVANDAAATVGRHKVTFSEFERAYRQTEESYRQAYGEQFTKEMAQQIGLPMQVLNGLVAEKIMIAEAERMGIAVTDREVRENILQQEVFRGPAGFVGEEAYRQVLRSNGFTPDSYERLVRNQMLSQKVRSVLAQSLWVADSEVEEAYRGQTERASIRYLRLPVSRFAAEVEPDPGRVQAYFDEHRNEFRIAEKRTARVLSVRPEELRSTIQIADSELRAWYDSHLTDYQHEEQIHARHILRQIDADRPESAARAVMETVRKRLAEGGDFAQLAAEFSEDPGSKGKGGDLGYFGRGRMIKEFEEAAFGASPGEIVGPIQTSFGLHLIEVLDRRTAGTVPFEEARESIRAQLANERVASAAEQLAKEVADRARREKMADAEAFAGLAEATPGVTFTATPPFGRDEPVAALGRANAATAAVFELAPGETSDPVPFAGGWVVLQVATVEPPRLPELDEVKPRVEAAVALEAQRRLAVERLAEARVRLDAGTSLDDLAATFDLQVEESGEFGRNDGIGSLGKAPAVMAAAFELGEGAVGGPVGVEDSEVLFQVTGRKAFDSELFAQEKSATRTQVQNQRLGRVLATLVEKRRQELAVTYSPELLQNLNIAGGA